MADTRTQPRETKPAAAAAGSPGLARFLRWDLAVTIILIAAFGYGSADNASFATTGNLSFALNDIAEVAIIALPMTLLVVCGEVDLSVASMLGLSSALAGSLWDAGYTFEMIVPLVLLVGLAGGLVNGLLVTKVGLPSLAVTIGTMTLYRGLASVVLGTKAVAEFPQEYADLTQRTVLGFIPFPIALFGILAIITAVVLHATGLGRAMFAIGSQQEAAFFAGIRVKRIKLALFALTGVVASFAGIVFTLRYGSARADNGMGFEMTVIAAVLLGGVDFDGGRGTLGGVVSGLLLIALLRNLLTLNDVANEVQSIVTGVLLVVSVLTPRAVQAIGQRRRRSEPESGAPPGAASAAA
ncbi:ABC transporter permease [Streptodolium elevatio]|uniref:Autoinducer 2 import system permease protein LsrD n=1 Tax=Streptodolium elevatio TaxID=3157996 RepID=A0ABV3DG35_9ACTN